MLLLSSFDPVFLSYPLLPAFWYKVTQFQFIKFSAQEEFISGPGLAYWEGWETYPWPKEQ